MRITLILLVLALFVVGCASTPTPEPTLEPTAVPTVVPQPTQTPTNTPLPPTPTLTNTPPPPTNTPIPSSPTPTATNTRPPVTAGPTEPPATPTETPVPFRFGAPALVEPGSGDLRQTSDNLEFRWRPVGALGGNECYLLTVRVTNTVDSQYAEQPYLAACGDPGNSDVVKFVLNKRPPAPDYAGLVEIATARTPANRFVVTWTLTVVQNNGADPLKPDPALYAPISPTSAPFEFELQG